MCWLDVERGFISPPELYRFSSTGEGGQGHFLKMSGNCPRTLVLLRAHKPEQFVLEAGGDGCDFGPERQDHVAFYSPLQFPHW